MRKSPPHFSSHLFVGLLCKMYWIPEHILIWIFTKLVLFNLPFPSAAEYSSKSPCSTTSCFPLLQSYKKIPILDLINSLIINLQNHKNSINIISSYRIARGCSFLVWVHCWSHKVNIWSLLTDPPFSIRICEGHDCAVLPRTKLLLNNDLPSGV